MNPYEDMPKSSFWRSGVVEDESFEDIHMPKWGISPSDCIVTMGSCFAQHVGKKLKTTGFKVPYYDAENGIKSKAYSANYGNIYFDKHFSCYKRVTENFTVMKNTGRLIRDILIQCDLMFLKDHSRLKLH